MKETHMKNIDASRFSRGSKIEIPLINQFTDSPTYRSWLIKYFESIGYIEKKDTMGVYKFVNDPNNYFNDNRNFDQDVINFGKHIKEWAPATKKGALSCVKNFLMFNNVALQPGTLYQIRQHQKGAKRVTAEKVPTREELKQILSFGNGMHKAMFLVMASSGMRPGEVVQITLDDIFLDEEPARISIPYDITKTKEPRDVFISSEAEHYLELWLKIREDYISCSRNYSNPDDQRLFPMSYDNLKLCWINLIKKAGFDEKDTRNAKSNKVRYQMTLHKIRKFFRTSMSDNDVPVDAIEQMMGHNSESMRQVYTNYSIQQLREHYMKGEPNLLIFATPINQAEVDDLKSKMDILQKQMMSILEMKKQEPDLVLEDFVEATFEAHRRKVKH